MEKNLTTGSVFKNVVLFSLPYLLSYFLQTLYGMADLFIIGQFEGVASTTAVSIGSQVMHMLTVMIVGLSMGTTVSVGQAVGAGNRKQAAHNIGNTVILFLVLSIALTAILLSLVHPIVVAMSTPTDAVSGTVTYLTICFIGIPFITSYNIISSIFRGLGDSKSPMCFIATACAANIALDYLFMGVLHLGPAGAALGTTLSGNQCSCFPYRYFETQEHRSEKKRLQALPCGHGENFGDRHPNCVSGRPDSSCFYYYHDYCQSAWTE